MTYYAVMFLANFRILAIVGLLTVWSERRAVGEQCLHHYPSEPAEFEMGPAPRLQNNMEQVAAEFFEPKLRDLGLSVADIEKQSLQELEDSLDRIADAMQRPEQFGTVRLKITADTGAIIAKATSEAHVEVGILPVLLHRKKLILDRIKLLRPESQIDDLRRQITKAVDDPMARQTLLSVLDKQKHEQHEFSERIEAESRKVGQALEIERDAIQHSVTLAKLEVIVDTLGSRLQSKSDELEKSLSLNPPTQLVSITVDHFGIG